MSSLHALGLYIENHFDVEPKNKKWFIMDKDIDPFTIWYHSHDKKTYIKWFDTTHPLGLPSANKEELIQNLLNTSEAKACSPLSAPEIYNTLTIPEGKIFTMEHLDQSLDVSQLSREEIFVLDAHIKQTMSYLEGKLRKPLNQDKKEMFLQYFSTIWNKLPVPHSFKGRVFDALNKKLLSATTNRFVDNIHYYDKKLIAEHPDNFTIADRLHNTYNTDIKTINHQVQDYINSNPSKLWLSLSHGRSWNPHIFNDHLIDFKSTNRRNEYNDHIGLLYSKLLMDAWSYDSYESYKQEFLTYKSHIDSSPHHTRHDLKKVIITKLVWLYIDNVLLITRKENEHLLDTREKHFDHNHLLLQDLLQNTI